MVKKLLITGSCGFIFSNFIRLALKDKSGYSFVSVDKVFDLHNLHNVYIKNEKHKFHIGDVSDRHFINTLFALERPDIVIHGAAVHNTHVDESIVGANSFITSNVLGTQVIADACVKYNVDKLIYISTNEVYGQLVSENDKSWTEDSPLAPRNPCAASKAAGELVVRAAHETYGLNYNIARCCNNFGPRQSAKNFIPKIIRNILLETKMPIYGQGNQLREWIHVADTYSAIMTILKNGKPNETYNISTGYEFSNLEIFHEVCNIMEMGHELLTFVEDRKGHNFRCAMDFSKIKSIGWEPKLKFKDSLNLCIQWYINNKWHLQLNKT